MFKTKKGNLQDYINLLGFMCMGYLLTLSDNQWMVYVALAFIAEMLIVNTMFIFNFNKKQQTEESQEEK